MTTAVLDTKECRTCRVEKSRDEFFYGRKRKQRELCRDCYKTANADRMRLRYQSIGSPARKRVRMQRYGLTDVQHDALMAVTTCAICGSQEDMHIDHDHETGVVRGRICGLCNRGLGLFKDDPERLRAAAAYIESAKGQQP